jgi:predicted GIY-YIG superfamily endonuclease
MAVEPPAPRRFDLKLRGRTAVYRAYTADDKLLYVGITDSVYARMAKHQTGSDWWALADYLLVEDYAERREALSRERQLIKQHQPPYNTVHKHPALKAKAKREAARPRCANKGACPYLVTEDSTYCANCIIDGKTPIKRLTDWQRRKYECEAEENSKQSSDNFYRYQVLAQTISHK